MKKIRNILHIVLMLAIVSAGLPVYHPIDINRDERVDLKDAILHVQYLATSAENPAAFGKGFENALFSMKVTAGLKAAIKADTKSGNTGGYGANHNFYLLEAAYNPFIVERTRIEEIKSNPPQSIANEPIKPPPRRNIC